MLATTRRPGRLSGLAVALALAAWAWAPHAARADDLDKMLYDQSAKLFKYIKEKKAKTVGVLKFRAKKGTEAESFHAGPVNLLMAERLEAVLVVGHDEDRPVKVI